MKKKVVMLFFMLALSEWNENFFDLKVFQTRLKQFFCQYVKMGNVKSFVHKTLNWAVICVFASPPTGGKTRD